MPHALDPSANEALLPRFEATAISEIPTIISSLHSSFHVHRKPQNLAWRISQMQKLYHGFLAIQPLAQAAMTADLGRAHFENHWTDFSYCKDELVNTLNNLTKWLADEPVTENVPWYLRLANETYIRKEPLGVVLIIGPWNYPWNLNLIPFIGAMAAGNCVVLKPSENSPWTAAVLKKLFEVAGLDRDVYRVVLGGREETGELLRCGGLRGMRARWDKICFTGSTEVGKVVMRAAAENLTPVLLELGGKNPCVISPTANLALAARRIAWAKCLNSGQSCTAPDYLLLPAHLEQPFLTAFKSSLAEFFPEGIEKSSDYTRIINPHHFNRLLTLLKSTRGDVALGGNVIDEKDLLMEPTLVKLGHIRLPSTYSDNPDTFGNEDIDGEWNADPLMQGEIFGPILSYVTYDPAPQSKSSSPITPILPILTRHSDTSLGAYLFSTSHSEQQEFLSHTRSGGACINEAFLNTFIPGLPFGGVGMSGTGAYRSRFSIESFTHRRPVVRNKGGWTDWVVSGWRFPPFGQGDGWKWRMVEWAVRRPGSWGRRQGGEVARL